MLSEPHFPQICMCSSTQKLSRPCLGIFMEESSHKHNWLNQWLLVIASNRSPSGFPRHGQGRRGSGEGPEIPILNHVLSYPGNQHPALERRHSRKSHLIHLTRDTLTAFPTSVISRVFGALCQDRGQRPKMYLLLINITRSRWPQISVIIWFYSLKIFQQLSGLF